MSMSDEMSTSNESSAVTKLRKDARIKRCWSCTVGAFYDAFMRDNPSDVRLELPSYQRAYAWMDEQCQRLLLDLEAESGKENAAYHLGTVIFHREKKRDESSGQWEYVLNIVDGQQRLRTFELLLNKDVRKDVKTSCFYVRKPEGEWVEGQNAEYKRAKKFFRERLEVYGNSAVEALKCGTLVCITVENLDEAFQLFETQNDRGMELKAEDLLKAFHYHAMTSGYSEDSPFQAPPPERQYELERQWKEHIDNASDNGSVLTKYLFWARSWVRCAQKESGRQWFDPATNLSEYKGITLQNETAPLQNVWVLSHLLRRSVVDSGLLKSYLIPKLGQARKTAGFEFDPFVSINQPIINGEDFFEYAGAYARLERRLFGNEFGNKSEAEREFYAFYSTFCLVEGNEACPNVEVNDFPSAYLQRYARDVYKTFLLLVVDRFGEEGLQKLYLPLWFLAYHERLQKDSLFPQRAGRTYGVVVCQLLESQASLNSVLMEICQHIKQAYLEEDDVKQFLKVEIPRVDCQKLFAAILEYACQRMKQDSPMITSICRLLQKAISVNKA